MRIMGFVGLMLIAGSVMPGPTRANLLTFNGPICNGGALCNNSDTIDQSYGDSAGVDIQYRLTASGPLAGLRFWDSAYSDLTNIAWSSGNPPAEIFLKPTAGNSVTLNGFDLGAWPHVDRTTQISIKDGLNNILENIALLTVNGINHYHFTSSASSTTGIKIQFGPNAFNVGIDNIDFTVGAPEPATLTLFGGALAGLALLRNRRRKTV